MSRFLFLLSASLVLLIPTTLLAQEVYHNPVDGKDYVTDHWQSYNPEAQKPQIYKRIKNEGVILLTSEKEVDSSIDANTLANYIISIEKVLDQDIHNRPDNGQVMIQVQLSKNGSPDIKMSRKGDLSEDFLQKVYEHLQSSSYPQIKNGDVKFQVMFSIAGT